MDLAQYGLGAASSFPQADMLTRMLAVGMVSLPFLLGTANATPINLLANGSFEDGGGSLTGWTTSGTQQSYAPTVVTTGTACCFGETVPVDSVAGGSPDAAGNHGVYFVDDLANQSLSQSLHLAIGHYEIGFDAYAPYNGFNNSGDASFVGTIAGVLLASYTVKTQNTPGIWLHYSGIADVLADGIYNASFNFQTHGGASADVVIDRVYIAASTETGGTPIGGAVPEPATLALLGLGLGGLGLGRRKKA